MKMIHAAHALLVTAATGAVLQNCFAFVLQSKGRHSILVPSNRQSHLFYYKSDEPFSERLSQVQSELEAVKDEGLQQFVIDELMSAEMKLSFASKISDGDKDEMRLAKQILKGALKQGREIANEVKEVKRGFDELQAAKILEGATEDIVAKDVLVEKDLEKVMESVAIALKDAEEVLRTAVLTAASQDGMTDEVKDSLVKKLELSAQTVEATIKVADSAAKTAKQMVIDDDVALAQMEKTAIRLADAIENTETVTASLEGSEGGAEVDAVADSLKIASDEMVNDLAAVDNIAAAVTKKIEMQADAVLSMDEKAGQAVGTINAAKATIEQSDSDTDKTVLKASLQESADKIQVDEHAAEELAKAITSDANTDAAAERVISDADHVFDELIDSVKETVEEVVSDYDSGEELDDADVISEELDVVQNDEEAAEKAIKSLEEAEEKVSESAVEELQVEQIKSVSKSESTSAEVKTEETTAVAKVEESEPDSDSSTISEPTESQSVLDDKALVAKDNTDVEGAKTIESVSDATDLPDIKEIEDGNKVEIVKLSDKATEVEGGESNSPHEVLTASIENAQKVEAVEETNVSTSTVPDAMSAVEDRGNIGGELSNQIANVKTDGAEAHVSEASEQIVENIKSGVTSASNIVEDLASKTIAAGDSLASSIASTDAAAPVTETVSDHVVAVVTAFSFLHM